MKQTPVIRIVKKARSHGEHHGGSWKVAYADFVTAMMAFFLVMWIIGLDQPVREQIQNYFNNPFSASTSRAGISQIADGGKSAVGRGFGGVIDDPGWRQVAFDTRRERLRRAEVTLQEEIDRHPELKHLSKFVEIRTTPAGLTVELIQGEGTTFFESGSAVVPAPARKLLTILAGSLGRLGRPLVIEGHTDARPYRGRSGYSNWELSTDRANAARRVMEGSGLRAGQVHRVSGYGPSRPRNPARPTDPANRRVTILVAWPEPTAPDAARDAAAGGSRGPFTLDIRP